MRGGYRSSGFDRSGMGREKKRKKNTAAGVDDEKNEGEGVDEDGCR